VSFTDGILIDPNQEKIESALKYLQLKFEVQDKGDLLVCLGVKDQKHPDGSIESVQMQLIDSILAVLKSVEHGGCNQAKTYKPHCKHNGKINKDEGGKEFDCSWDYKSVIELFEEICHWLCRNECSSMCTVHDPDHENS
jgi:hypothetical protein